MSLTGTEAEKLISKAQYDNYVAWRTERYPGSDIAEFDETDDPDWLEGVNDGTVVDGYVVELVEQFGGEGKGDEGWVVYRVSDQLFKKDAYYSSYDGFDWDYDSMYEVESYEVSVTRYRKI